MNTNSESIIKKNRVFVWLGFATSLLLLLPALGGQLTNEVQWKIGDFIVMGSLLFGFGSLFIFVSRKAIGRNRVLLVILLAIAFLLLWAELAVGIFTNIGS